MVHLQPNYWTVSTAGQGLFLDVTLVNLKTSSRYKHAGKAGHWDTIWITSLI